jgi:hypothetical protein
MSKLTLQLSAEMDRVLDQLADSRQLPKAQVLRRAMLLMQFLDDQVATEHDIVLKNRRTGESSRLVFESQLSDRTAVATAGATAPGAADPASPAEPAADDMRDPAPADRPGTAESSQDPLSSDAARSAPAHSDERRPEQTNA